MVNSCSLYLTQVRERSSLNTASAYERDLCAFSEFFAAQNKLHPNDITSDDIQEYIDGLKETLTESSVLRRLSVLRGFFKFLVSKGICSENPASEVKKPGKSSSKKELVVRDRKQIEQLMAQPDMGDAKGKRDKAMLELLYATGMRVSELLDLEISNLNLKTGIVICQCGKRSRAIPLYPLAVRCLEEYLENSRPAFVKENDNCPYLFVNVSGERMTRQGFWKLLKEYAHRAGIKDGISPHTLRHSFALHLLENGADAKEVQTIMGNADSATVKGYVKYVRSKLSDRALDFHPHAQRYKG